MIKLCALIITVFIVAEMVESGTIPDGQPKAIVVAIIMGGDGLKGLAGIGSAKIGGRVSCDFNDVDCHPSKSSKIGERVSCNLNEPDCHPPRSSADGTKHPFAGLMGPAIGKYNIINSPY